MHIRNMAYYINQVSCCMNNVFSASIGCYCKNQRIIKIDRTKNKKYHVNLHNNNVQNICNVCPSGSVTRKNNHISRLLSYTIINESHHTHVDVLKHYRNSCFFIVNHTNIIHTCDGYSQNQLYLILKMIIVGIYS